MVSVLSILPSAFVLVSILIFVHVSFFLLPLSFHFAVLTRVCFSHTHTHMTRISIWNFVLSQPSMSINIRFDSQSFSIPYPNTQSLIALNKERKTKKITTIRFKSERETTNSHCNRLKIQRQASHIFKASSTNT